MELLVIFNSSSFCMEKIVNKKFLSEEDLAKIAHNPLPEKYKCQFEKDRSDSPLITGNNSEIVL